MALITDTFAQWLNEWNTFQADLGIRGLVNIKRHVYGIRKDLKEAEELIEEFISITGCTNKGRAKSKILNLMRKDKENKDLTLVRSEFLKIASIWFEGTPRIGKKSGEAKLTVAQAELRHEQLMPLVVRLHKMCEELENGEDILEDFISKYYTLGCHDFTTKLFIFVNDIVDEMGIDEPDEVALASALLFCKNHYPMKLIQDLIRQGDKLGEVKRLTFNTWDCKCAAKEDEARIAAKQILTWSLYRVEGNTGYPTPQEENLYHLVLSTEKDCPWGEEWVVNGNTRLEDLLVKLKLEREIVKVN